MHKPLNILITTDVEEFINRQVESGMHNSPSEVIDAALHFYAEVEVIRQKRREQLNREIDIGLGELDSGKGIPAEEAKAILRSRRQSRKTA